MIGARTTATEKQRLEREQAKDYGLDTKGVPPAELRKQITQARKAQEGKDKLAAVMNGFVKNALAERAAAPVAAPAAPNGGVIQESPQATEPKQFSPKSDGGGAGGVGKSGTSGTTVELADPAIITGDAGSDAVLEDVSSTPGVVQLQFTIPRGDTGPVEEAPIDSNAYVRQDATWVNLSDYTWSGYNGDVTISGVTMTFSNGLLQSVTYP